MYSVEWFSKEFWINRANASHIDDVQYLKSHDLLHISDINSNLLNRIKKEGYLQLNVAQWNLDIKAMNTLVAELVRDEIPAPFAFLYDEFWVLFIKLNPIIEILIGSGFYRLPDFWAWHIDPKKKQSGWKPHRDKDYRSLNSDGTPKSITVWIPLSISTPTNGCMYIVPADKDPNYGSDKDQERAFDLTSIRALPAEAGTVFIWNQAVLHWGSQCSDFEVTPRISLAFEFQSQETPPYNEPLMNPYEVPNFEFRLKLIAKQIIQYQHMYPLDEEIKKFAFDLISN